jgi:RNA 2',3'-cyclic 3'-phosphodiesterase
MKRIFIAVDISDQARAAAADYIESLRGEFRAVRVGWEKAEKLHLTLKFLGVCEERQLKDLEKIAAEITAEISRFTIRIADTGVFPNERNPRVLWVDVKDAAGNLVKIHGLLEAKCEKIGFKREARRFVPHLTIGRIKEPNKARDLAEKHLKNKFEPVEFQISEIVIYESKLLPAGSVYSVASKHNLKIN